MTTFVKKSTDFITLLLGLCAAMSFFLMGHSEVALSIALATTLMTINFWLMKKIGLQLVNAEAGSKQVRAGIFLFIKLIALFVLVHLVMKYLPIDLVSFGIAAALAVLVSAIMVNISDLADQLSAKGN